MDVTLRDKVQPIALLIKDNIVFLTRRTDPGTAGALVRGRSPQWPKPLEGLTAAAGATGVFCAFS